MKLLLIVILSNNSSSLIQYVCVYIYIYICIYKVTNVNPCTISWGIIGNKFLFHAKEGWIKIMQMKLLLWASSWDTIPLVAQSSIFFLTSSKHSLISNWLSLFPPPFKSDLVLNVPLFIVYKKLENLPRLHPQLDYATIVLILAWPVDHIWYGYEWLRFPLATIEDDCEH